MWIEHEDKWSRSVLECILSPTSLSLCMKITCQYMNRRLFLLHQDPINILCMNIFVPYLSFLELNKDLGRGKGGWVRKGKGKKQLILICRLYKERILHKRFFQILLRIGLYLNPVVFLDGESYSNLERCKNAENMQI